MKKKLTYGILSFFTLGLILNSCDPEPTVPDQDKIYGTYFLDYNVTENKSTATASFYLEAPSSSNTQKLKLTHPANVLYNGKALVFESEQRYYTKEFVGQVESNFIYENYNGNQYSNVVSVVDTLKIFMSDSANVQSDFYFEIDGPPLAANEVVDIHIESISSEITFGSTFTNISGLNVQISASQLTSLGVGETIVKASRHATISDGVNASPAGGEIHTSYSIQDTLIIY